MTESYNKPLPVPNNEDIIIIDTRSPQAYEAEHIPGSINIPHRQMSQQSTAHLKKSAPIVTYCDGIGCNASTKGALAMTKLGFKVKELMGGLDWWKRDGHPTSSSVELTHNSSASCGCD